MKPSFLGQFSWLHPIRNHDFCCWLNEQSAPFLTYCEASSWATGSVASWRTWRWLGSLRPCHLVGDAGGVHWSQRVFQDLTSIFRWFLKLGEPDMIFSIGHEIGSYIYIYTIYLGDWGLRTHPGRETYQATSISWYFNGSTGRFHFLVNGGSWVSLK